MGVVYLGRDPVIGRSVALKTIRVTTEDDAEMREFNERFMREAQAAGTLSHPNIVTIHDVGEEVETQTSFIAMEYVEGKNLKQLLKEKVAFSWDRVAEIVMSVADALDYAHRRGIVHRDVKPANIIITSDGTVKITDFGIAKIEASSLTETGQFLGTPNYMSPEQVTGETVDGRSDLFSLGVVLYELLTKRKPFIGDNLTSISYKIVHEEFPAPQTWDATIPTEFNPILARALAKDPAARFQSGKEFHGALAEFRARHAEMEVLRDLGEMVAQAEKLGPVSTVESKDSPLPKPPAPAPPPVAPAGPPALGGGGTSLEDLVRRGRSDLNPALVGAAPALDGSIPDWSLDTDALKSPAEREAAKKRESEKLEPAASSPGTLISDVQRDVKRVVAVVPPAPTQIFNEENRPTERIQIAPGAFSAPTEAMKISTGEIKKPPVAVAPPPAPAPAPPIRPPAPPRDSTGPIPPRESSSGPIPPRDSTGPIPPRESSTGPIAPKDSTGPIRPRESTGPIPPLPRGVGGPPQIRDVSAPIPTRGVAAPHAPAARTVPPSARPQGRDVTGPVRMPTGPGAPGAPAGAPASVPAAPESLRETLKREINWRYAVLVVGAALVAGGLVVGLLAQRSCALAGRGADEVAAEEMLAKRKLLEEGTRLLGEGKPAEARAKFVEVVRLAPESVAGRAGLQKSDQILAKKQEEERKAAEVGAYLAAAREARDKSEWARVVVEAEGALAVDPVNVEAIEIRGAAQLEIAKQGKAARRKTEAQIRALKSAPKPTAAPAPTAAPEPVATEVPSTASAPPAGARVRLKIAFQGPIAQGYVMIRRNDVEIWRRAFDFGRKSGGGTLEGEVDVPAGPGEYKVWVIATDRSVNEYRVLPLTVGDGRTLSLDVDAGRKLAVSLR